MLGEIWHDGQAFSQGYDQPSFDHDSHDYCDSHYYCELFVDVPVRPVSSSMVKRHSKGGSLAD